MGNCLKKQSSDGAGTSYRVSSSNTRSTSGGRSNGAAADMTELRSVFKQFDLDGDGFIDERELRSVMKNMGQDPTDEEIRAMFKAADLNNDGQITFEEFVEISKANPMSLSLKTVFAELDVDGDGELTREEMVKAFARMGHKMADKEIDVILRQADINKDSRINFEEFVQMMCQRK